MFQETTFAGIVGVSDVGCVASAMCFPASRSASVSSKLHTISLDAAAMVASLLKFAFQMREYLPSFIFCRGASQLVELGTATL